MHAIFRRMNLRFPVSLKPMSLLLVVSLDSLPLSKVLPVVAHTVRGLVRYVDCLVLYARNEDSSHFEVFVKIGKACDSLLKFNG